MSEIADFLRARIAERRTLAEAAAEKAGSGDWRYKPGDDRVAAVQTFPDDVPARRELWLPLVTEAGSYIGDTLDDEIGHHIAANDPADVIADCDAKLAIIDDLLAERHEVIEDPWYTCAAATEEHDGGRCCDQNRRGKPCDCGRDARLNRRLAILAQPFAGHSDHKGEWWAP
jgi:hypothetical protein